jgi:hypothetical protein
MPCTISMWLQDADPAAADTAAAAAAEEGASNGGPQDGDAAAASSAADDAAAAAAAKQSADAARLAAVAAEEEGRLVGARTDAALSQAALVTLMAVSGVCWGVWGVCRSGCCRVGGEGRLNRAQLLCWPLLVL